MSYTIGTGGDIDTPRPNSLLTFAINYGGIYRPLKEESTIAFDNEARIIQNSHLQRFKYSQYQRSRLSTL